MTTPPIEPATGHTDLLAQILDYANRANPYPLYAELRKTPVLRAPNGSYVVSTYHEIVALMHDPRIGVAGMGAPAGSAAGGAGADAAAGGGAGAFIGMDPPEHDRFKLLVSRGFTPKRAELLRDRIRELAREIVDDVIERGECDLVHDVAGRLPSGLIAELMGIPRADGERLYELTELMHTTDDAVATPEQRGAATLEMLSYAGEVAARKRAEPGDDIASGLVQAEVDGVGLTDGELQWFFLLLVNAGGDTTRNLLASGIQLLFDHPDERARLAADLDGLLPTTVEEMLRYTSPVVDFRRTAMEDTVIGDQPIAAGDKLMIFYGSGNRDERQYGTDASELDVTRRPRNILTFSHGAHHCLGAAAARMQSRVTLTELMARCPHFEVDESGIVWAGGSYVRRPLSVPFTVTG